jgi:hypothetical protein
VSSERNQNRDLVARRVSALNHSYDRYTLGVDACSRLQLSRSSLAQCFGDTYTKSGIRPAIDGFGEAIQQAEGLSQGGCRSAMRDLASSIAQLRMAVETFRTDASIGHFQRLYGEAGAFVKAHDASIKAMEATQQPC